MQTEVSEDRERLILRGGNPPIVSIMSTADVDATLKALGIARGAMLPEIPLTWSAGQEQVIEAQRNPHFLLEREALNGDPLLHLRHPHLGWLHFVFSRDDARRLGEKLVSDSNAAPPPGAGSA